MVQFNHCPPGREKTTSATVLPQVDILQESVKISLVIAEVAELADALGSGPSGGNAIGVQIPASALLRKTNGDLNRAKMIRSEQAKTYAVGRPRV